MKANWFILGIVKQRGEIVSLGPVKSNRKRPFINQSSFQRYGTLEKARNDIDAFRAVREREGLDKEAFSMMFIPFPVITD